MLDRCAAHGIAYLPFFPLGRRPGRPRRVGAWTRSRPSTASPPRQLALAWLLHRSPAMLTIPGTSKVAHLEENIAAAALTLDDEDLATLVA